jgi:ArsR family transcriptional regulator
MNLVGRDVDELFAALGDRIRLRLACCLHSAPTGACVCELVDALDVSQPNVSRHLKVLKAAGFLEERRDGRWMYYRWRQPDHPLLDGICSCIETVCDSGDVQEDVRRLRTRLDLRRDGRCVLGTRMLPGRPSRRRGGERHVRLPVV